MKIIVSTTAGFCMGVKRAVDLALENAARVENGLKTVGPLIHNSQTIEVLRERRVVEFDVREPGAGPQTLLVRAHGIPPVTERRFREQGHDIIDGTCPKVKTVHRVIQRYREQGHLIVITGDAGHAEVIGLLGYAGDAGILIHSPEMVDALPDAEKICLVSQTTFDRKTFELIAERCRQRFHDRELVVKKTICAATDQRQAETESLARQVDAMIVVGGRNSANTRRLASIAAACGTPTQLVETEEEIDWPPIASCQSIGITAGASTPNWMIKRITEYLALKDRTERCTLPNLIRTVFETASNLNIFVALGAVAIYAVSTRLQDIPAVPLGALLAFLYFLSMYLWNSMTSIDVPQRLLASRFRFYRRHRLLLLCVIVFSVSTVMLISMTVGKTLATMMAAAILLGSLYHFTIVPPALRHIFRYKRLKDIPTSRDLLVALAWGVVLTFIPQAMRGPLAVTPLTVFCFAWIFVLAFLRSLVFDLRDIEGDRILGRETLITIVGERRARRAIQIIIWAGIVFLLLVPWTTGLYQSHNHGLTHFLLQVPALLYAAGFIRWNRRLAASPPALFNLLADGIFFVAGLGALVTTIFLR